MNLHRSHARPEWASVPAARRNYWQRRAAATGGIVTLGNIVILVGLLVSLTGAIALWRQQCLLVAILLILGRSADLLDGWIAEATATKSPLGEAVDTTIDKIVTLTVALAAITSGLLSGGQLTAIAAPQAAIAVVALWRVSHGRRLHPGIIGKLSMAYVWVVLLIIIGLRAAQLMPAIANVPLATILAVSSGLLSSLALVLHSRAAH